MASKAGKAGKDRLAEELAALSALAEAPHTPEALAELRKALGHGSSFVVARAAEIAGQAQLTELIPLLVKAFARFFERPVETDKNCRAKNAIATALWQLDHDDAALFLRGLRHVQREPVWGGSVDTAPELRGICALALARIEHPERMNALVDLLLDPEWVARAHAARAIGVTGLPEGVPLLRYKVRLGDEESQVLSECFGALLDLDPRGSFPFVTGFLEPPGDQRCDAAGLALGQSRRDDAYPVLQAWAARSHGERLRVPLLALAMLRLPQAFDELVGIVTHGPKERAAHALAALAVHRYDEALRARVEDAVMGRKETELHKVFADHWIHPR